MLYTSYFGNIKNIKENNCRDTQLVSISNVKPYWCPEDVYDFGNILGPGESLLKRYKAGLVDEKQYEEEYLVKLNNNKELILKSIDELSSLSSNDIVFLCYEKPPKFCHRHIFANWLMKNGYYHIEEYPINLK